MPERIATAELAGIDAETLETEDAYPGAYGFFVRLTCDPGEEWEAEFHSVYDTALYPGKPPVTKRGDRLCVFYLPRYADDLPRFLRFLEQMVAETNRSVEKRNSVLPDEEKQKDAFRESLRAVSRTFMQ